MFQRMTRGLAIGLLLAVPAPAWAHNLGAEVKIVGEIVQVDAFFDDDTPAQDAPVRVEDETGRMVAEGRTDAKGRWTFPRPGPGRYRVVVDAGGGHRAKRSFEIPGAVATGAAEPRKVSEGPTREEFTRSRWPEALLGISFLAVLAVIAPKVLRAARGTPPPNPLP